jgi:hypothetical protein
MFSNITNATVSIPTPIRGHHPTNGMTRAEKTTDYANHYSPRSKILDFLKQEFSWCTRLTDLEDCRNAAKLALKIIQEGMNAGGTMARSELHYFPRSNHYQNDGRYPLENQHARQIFIELTAPNQAYGFKEELENLCDHNSANPDGTKGHHYFGNRRTLYTKSAQILRSDIKQLFTVQRQLINNIHNNKLLAQRQVSLIPESATINRALKRRIDIFKLAFIKNMQTYLNRWEEDRETPEFSYAQDVKPTLLVGGLNPQSPMLDCSFLKAERGLNYASLLFNPQTHPLDPIECSITSFENCYITGDCGHNTDNFPQTRLLPIVNLVAAASIEEPSANPCKIQAITAQLDLETVSFHHQLQQLAAKVQSDIENLYHARYKPALKNNKNHKLVFACHQGMNRSFLYAAQYELRIHLQLLCDTVPDLFKHLRLNQDQAQEYIDHFTIKLRSDLLYPWGQQNGLGAFMTPGSKESNILSITTGLKVLQGMKDNLTLEPVINRRAPGPQKSFMVDCE